MVKHSILLLENADEYAGNYVAMKSYHDKRVIAHGKDPQVVLNTAKEKGVKSPVIFYIPEPGSKGVY